METSFTATTRVHEKVMLRPGLRAAQGFQNTITQLNSTFIGAACRSVQCTMTKSPGFAAT